MKKTERGPQTQRMRMPESQNSSLHTPRPKVITKGFDCASVCEICLRVIFALILFWLRRLRRTAAKHNTRQQHRTGARSTRPWDQSVPHWIPISVRFNAPWQITFGVYSFELIITLNKGSRLFGQSFERVPDWTATWLPHALRPSLLSKPIRSATNKA